MEQKDTVLPFADAPSIVSAHQKDTYFQYLLENKLQDVVKIFKGQRFANLHPEEITVGAKTLYLTVTTLLSSRTLGEEYVDLIYVSRNGKRIPKFTRKLAYVFSFTLLPFLISRIVREFKTQDDDEETRKDWRTSWLSSYTQILDTLTNLHVAIFYFNGKYYQLSKRIFGLRYAFGHNIQKDESQTGNYSLLGTMILLQFSVKFLNKLRKFVTSLSSSRTNSESLTNSLNAQNIKNSNHITKLFQLTKPELRKTSEIDLSDSSSLPYIPESGRKCMLCLSYMIDPSTAPCGHIFCWTCIADWCREHPECPLCRQSVFEQNLLPLR